MQPLGEAEFMTLPVPKEKEDEPVTNLMTKLEIIIDGSETIWFCPNSSAHVELMLKGC